MVNWISDNSKQFKVIKEIFADGNLDSSDVTKDVTEIKFENAIEDDTYCACITNKGKYLLGQVLGNTITCWAEYNSLADLEAAI